MQCARSRSWRHFRIRHLTRPPDSCCDFIVSVSAHRTPAMPQSPVCSACVAEAGADTAAALRGPSECGRRWYVLLSEYVATKYSRWDKAPVWLSWSGGKKATHPCPCGYRGDPQRECRCSSKQVQNYAAASQGRCWTALKSRRGVGCALRVRQFLIWFGFRPFRAAIIDISASLSSDSSTTFAINSAL